MDRTPGRKTLVASVAAVVAALLISGLGVWTWMDGRLAEAEDRASRAEERIEELEADVSALSAALEAAETAGAEASSDATDGTSDVATAGAEDPAEEDGRFFCYVESYRRVNGTIVLSVDYAQLLTGAEAAAAASAAGEESPPPNDYFIVNENPRLREFELAAAAPVRLVTIAEGVDPTGYDTTADSWYDMLTGATPGLSAVRDAPYWVTVEAGRIVEVEEQFLP